MNSRWECFLKDFRAPICTGYQQHGFPEASARLHSFTESSSDTASLGQERLALGCTGVAAMLNVCIVLFVLAHIHGVTQNILMVSGNAVQFEIRQCCTI